MVLFPHVINMKIYYQDPLHCIFMLKPMVDFTIKAHLNSD